VLLLAGGPTPLDPFAIHQRHKYGKYWLGKSVLSRLTHLD